MDGNGYPRGLKGKKISRYGQILGISELISKVFESNKHKVSWTKLKIMLKMNSKRYGSGLIRHLDIFHDQAANAQSREVESKHIIDQMYLIAKLFSDFNDLSDQQSSNPIYEFSQNRLAELRLALFSAGIDPRDPESMKQIYIDDPVCAEFASIIDETIWQFKTLLSEVSRQWPDTTELTKDMMNSHDNSWLNQMKLVLNTA